jgi:hypothetical protein
MGRLVNQMEKRMEHIIETDGITVWVNTAHECIGRFGQMGIDIHTTIEAQAAGSGQCLECSHGPVSIEHWERFKVAMLEHYGVVVTDKHKPRRFLQ